MSNSTPAAQKPNDSDFERLAYKPMEAAARLGIGRNKIFELIASGEIASVKYGQTRLIPRQALDRFLGVEQAA